MTVGAVLLTWATAEEGLGLDPMEELGACSAIQRLVRTLQNAGVRRTVLLTSRADRDQMEKHMAHWGVLCRIGEEAAGTVGPLQEGIRALGGRCDRLLFAAADVPFLTEATVAALLDQPALLARPQVDGAWGGMWCVDSGLFPALLEVPHDLPLDQLPQCLEVPVAPVPVADEGALAGRRECYPRLLVRRRKGPMQVTFKLRLCRERPFFGPGTVQLLTLIDETESVRLACQRMGVSYSKGWKMIAVMEEELGERVVLRRQGGRNGGAASLTPAGRTLLERYQRLELRCQELVQQAAREIFPTEE